MSEERIRPKLKPALTAFPERYALPGRPAGASPAALDAHRQTSFLLDGDLATFERAMDLQLRIVGAGSRLRTVEAAALFGFWSRSYAGLSDTCLLMTRGSYASCPPPLRTALDCLAAQRSLIRDGYAEYEEWLRAAVSQAKEQQALAVALGRFRAGSVLAEDAALGPAYRLLTELTMPHFGSTALLTAPDSNLQKLALTFGDQAFHLGWAELICGWLLLLAGAQIQAVADSGIFAIDGATEEDANAVTRQIALALANQRRCRVEEVDGRFIFHNFRRTSSGQPRRVVLWA